MRRADTPITRLPPAAEIAGYAGVAPFALCLLGVGLLPDYAQRELAQRVAVAYGAVVLTFVGGVHWGLALAGRMPWRPVRILGAVAPAVIAATAVVMGGQRGLALLVVGLGVFWLYEHRQVGSELPDEYMSLRRNLSLGACILLALTLMLSDNAGLN
ncbi:MAG TPA: DUF3429 domain-containing protein [Steroidobacteraceae bacterium]|nr:DUF3429 domain-containing protein [Steroidobacteraceae bacterium]